MVAECNDICISPMRGRHWGPHLHIQQAPGCECVHAAYAFGQLAGQATSWNTKLLKCACSTSIVATLCSFDLGYWLVLQFAAVRCYLVDLLDSL